MIGALLYIAVGFLSVLLAFQMKTIRPFGSLVVGVLFQAVQVGALVFVAALIGGNS